VVKYSKQHLNWLIQKLCPGYRHSLLDASDTYWLRGTRAEWRVYQVPIKAWPVMVHFNERVFIVWLLPSAY